MAKFEIMFLHDGRTKSWFKSEIIEATSMGKASKMFFKKYPNIRKVQSIEKIF